MSILKNRKAVLAILALGFGYIASAQEGIVQIQQNEKIPQLLELKIKLREEGKLNNRYKVQLFYGQLEDANKVLEDYRSLSYDWSSKIAYETPNYKVWIGNFRNRLEADRALKQLKIDFPNAFIFKPDRK